MNSHRPALCGVVLLACLALGVAFAADGPRRDPATVTLASDLRQSPAVDGAVVGSVAAGDAVSVLEMRGDRARVEAGGRVGWMPAAKLHIGSGTASSGGGGDRSWLRGITGLLGGGGSSAGERGAKVPIGIRGLQREDVASAQPDPQAVERLERYRASSGDALAYAARAGLESREVEYLEAASTGGDRGGNR